MTVPYVVYLPAIWKVAVVTTNLPRRAFACAPCSLRTLACCTVQRCDLPLNTGTHAFTLPEQRNQQPEPRLFPFVYRSHVCARSRFAVHALPAARLLFPRTCRTLERLPHSMCKGGRKGREYLLPCTPLRLVHLVFTHLHCYIVQRQCIHLGRGRREEEHWVLFSCCAVLPLYSTVLRMLFTSIHT